MQQKSDGYLAVTKTRAVVTIGTQLDFDKIHYNTLADLHTLANESGFTNKVDSFDIVCDGDSKSISMVASIETRGHTEKYFTDRLNEFKHLIRASGILRSPIVCRLKVPVHYRHGMH